MYFIIKDFGILNPDWDLPTPREGQLVELWPISLEFPDGSLEKAYKLIRPPLPFDNNEWGDTEFDQFPVFYPRWREFTDLETRPRLCRGFLKQIENGLMAAATTVVLAANLRSRFECIVYPSMDLEIQLAPQPSPNNGGAGW